MSLHLLDYVVRRKKWLKLWAWLNEENLMFCSFTNYDGFSSPFVTQIRIHKRCFCFFGFQVCIRILPILTIIFGCYLKILLIVYIWDYCNIKQVFSFKKLPLTVNIAYEYKTLCYFEANVTETMVCSSGADISALCLQQELKGILANTCDGSLKLIIVIKLLITFRLHFFIIKRLHNQLQTIHNVPLFSNRWCPGFSEMLCSWESSEMVG